VFGSVGLDGTMPVPPFEVDNRGKRSIVLDLRDFDDHALFDRLLSTADVLVTNMRPGALERLELGPGPDLRASSTPRVRGDLGLRPRRRGP
jgi:crotonobetainyl-CoA:carnitine CoA-transferase CaiB-like acyl-CoA transferase